MRLTILLMCMLLLIPPISFSAVIFSENFDSQADWQPSPGTNEESTSSECASGDCSASVPTGWSFYRTTGHWWSPTYEDTIRITSDNARGGSGKAYTQFNESRSGGDGWGADGMIIKLFASDYTELYTEFWMKTKTGFQFNTADDAMLKIFRCAHYDRTGNIFQFFSTGNNGPIYVFDFKLSQTWGWRHMHSFRCDPQETCYYCNPDRDTNTYFGDADTLPGDSGQAADGQWHKYTFRLKMNTYNGSSWNSNGIMEFWLDGNLMKSITDLRQIEDGGASTVGYNYIGIGGNAYNSYSADENKDEQWYAIDDIRVSTTPFDTCESPIGGNSQFQLGDNSTITFK